jgi:CPA2 family monovalent cation:H+ antiporter-2
MRLCAAPILRHSLCITAIIRRRLEDNVSSSINLPVYSDALVVLGTAGIVVPLLHRWGLSPILGYLGAGALLGPLGLGSFISSVPILYWLTVVDAKNVAGIAELGVVFLLFVIGLELSYERLLAMRRLVFGLGGLQVGLTTAILAVAFIMADLKAPTAVVLASCLSLSSTAIVLELISRQGRLPSSTGRTSFAVLLAQDLAVIPLLMFESMLGSDAGSSVFTTIGIALVQAIAAVAIIVLVGRIVLRPLFRQVARTQSIELFIAATLFVILATAVVAALANLSMALGAFVAGLLFAETEYRKAIEATIEPFKGLLLGIFFFTVGMSIDVRELLREPIWLLAGVVGLISIKAIVLVGLTRAFNVSWQAAIETGLLLGPGGEFAFLGLGLAVSLGILTQQIAGFTLAVTSLTMALIPLLNIAAQWFSRYLEKRPPEPNPVLTVVPKPQQRHAIVVGYGRVGKLICSMLRRHGVVYTAVDNDAVTITEDRAKGHAVYFGDATRPTFLKVCGLMEASAVVITIHTHARIDEIVSAIRARRPEIPIISRARDAEHASHLYGIGVTDAVPETIEASLQLSETALVGLGIPIGAVIASIHEQRDEFRSQLQQAAKEAGLATIHSIRAKNISSMPGPRMGGMDY